MEYEADTSVLNPLPDVAIRDESPGTLFQTTNHDFKVEVGEIHDEGAAGINFDRMEANNQVPDFFLAFWISEHTKLFDWGRHLKLMVRDNPMSRGRIMFQCDWKLTGPAGESRS